MIFCSVCDKAFYDEYSQSQDIVTRHSRKISSHMSSGNSSILHYLENATNCHSDKEMSKSGQRWDAKNAL